MTRTADEQIMCEFGGNREGSAALTWGQYQVWNNMRPHRPGVANMPKFVWVPDGLRLTGTAVGDVISGLVTRHEALRTRILSSGDGPYQFVKRAGALPLAIVRCAEDAVGSAGESLVNRIVRPPFDYSVEGPIRVGLVVVGDRVRLIVLGLCRIVVDDYSLQIMERELQLLFRGETFAAEPALQPLDLAADQASSRWRRHSARALKYWTNMCENTAPLPPVAATSDSPAHVLNLVSRALWLATRSAARRYEVSTSTVLLAASAALLGRWTGNSTCGMSVVARNRFVPQYSEMVTSLAQRGPFVMDLAGRRTVGELIESTADAALRAYHHGYYDQEALNAVLERISTERGAEAGPVLAFNDLRSDAERASTDDDGAGVDDPITTTPRDALKSSRFHVEPATGVKWVKPPINLQVLPCHGAMNLRLHTDSRYMSPDRMEPFMREFAQLVTQAGGTWHRSSA
jgi:hypothetical protein